MTLQYTLNWVIFGEDPYEDNFSIKISTCTNINLLKAAIRENIKVPDLIAKDLRDLPLGIVKNEEIINICTKDMGESGVEMTGGLKKISHYFHGQPNEEHIHIIIRLPTGKSCHIII